MKRNLLVAMFLAVLASAAWPAMASASEQDTPTPDMTVTTGTTAHQMTVCRPTAEGYEPVTIPAVQMTQVTQARIDFYREHGARWPGEEVPGLRGPGRYLDENCSEVSWLLGVTVVGCVTAVESAAECDPTAVAGGASAGLFASGAAVVQDRGVEFASPEGAVQADFDGDYLTLTVAAGQPAMQFVFDFVDWQLWDYFQVGNPSLVVLDTQAGSRQLGLTTASTEGAAGPRSVTYRMVLEHSAGIAPFRNSTITVDPLEVPADGVSTTTVTLQLLDVLGNPPAEERFVELFMNEQFGTIGPVTYLGDGRYTATVTAGTAPGAANIVAMVDYLDLDLTVGTVVLTPVVPGPLPE